MSTKFVLDYITSLYLTFYFIKTVTLEYLGYLKIFDSVFASIQIVNVKVIACVSDICLLFFAWPARISMIVCVYESRL